MSAASLTALVAAIAGLITAVGGVIAVIRHVNGPAHQDGTQTPQAHP